MAKIEFVLQSGEAQIVDSAGGESLMHAALRAGVKGIVGECGGNKICATCHVYVDSEWMPLLPPLSPDEDDLLEFAVAPRRENSRLACQIPVSDAANGIRVTIPG